MRIKNSRGLLGIIGTLFWFLLCLGIVRSKWNDAHALKLNEWGDVFAGFVAPLAFFWFVLSFLQQSEELKQNTKALELQAEELRASVEHQRSMVEITRLQVENELESSRQERARIRQSAQPKFVFLGCSGLHSGGSHQYTLRYHNVGNTASELSIIVDPMPPRHSSLQVPSVIHDGILEIALTYSETLNWGTKLSIYYLDAMGMPGEYHCFLDPDKGGTINSKPLTVSREAPSSTTAGTPFVESNGAIDGPVSGGKF